MSWLSRSLNSAVRSAVRQTFPRTLRAVVTSGARQVVQQGGNIVRRQASSLGRQIGGPFFRTPGPASRRPSISLARKPTK